MSKRNMILIAIIVGIISGIAAITIINNIYSHRKWYSARNIM